LTSEHFDVVVVGGGQAGLAVGFHLARRNINFVILDAYPRVGEAWRRRWESLRLFTPARLDGLPGTPFPDRARALPTKDEMANYLESYAGHHKLPIRLGTRVEALSREGNPFVLIAGDRRFEADQVVVATGGHPNPKRPDFAAELDQGILQLHSSDYRDPSQLQDGDVLVVGAGNSGAEIALDAAQQHRVWLAGRPTGSVSAVLYSRPSWWLATRLITVNTPIGRKMNMQLRGKGTPLVRIREQDFGAAGITRVPRVEGVEAGKPRLEGGRQLDVKNVVWCTGFKHDYSWIQLPAAAGGHIPPHERGVVPSEPGLYFMGLPFQFGHNSALIDGVGRDAEYVVSRIAETRTKAKPMEVRHVRQT
jgi:putative flavoprotein involved in K+ transport